jgi:hypothetical protein
MSINEGVLSLSKWELLDLLSTVNSYLFVFGKPADFSRVLKRIYDEKPLNKNDRAKVLDDLKSAICEEIADFVVVFSLTF